MALSQEALNTVREAAIFVQKALVEAGFVADGKDYSEFKSPWFRAVFKHDSAEYYGLATLDYTIESEYNDKEDGSQWKTYYSVIKLNISNQSYENDFEEYAKNVSAICKIARSLELCFFVKEEFCVKTAEQVKSDREKRESEAAAQLLRDQYASFISDAFTKARLGKCVDHNLAPHPDGDDVTLKFPHGANWRVFQVTANTIVYTAKTA